MDTDAIYRRAGGRRRYNAQRRFRATLRLVEVARLLGKYSMIKHGYQARIARELGVSPSTICRDLARLNREWRRWAGG